MHAYRVPRNGRPDLCFMGERIAMVSDGALSAKHNWWEITLYRTAADKYVLASAYHVVNACGLALHTATCFTSLDALLAYFAFPECGAGTLAGELLCRAARHKGNRGSASEDAWYRFSVPGGGAMACA